MPRTRRDAPARSRSVPTLLALVAATAIGYGATAHAVSDEKSAKPDIKGAGKAIGETAREAGHEAKHVGREIGQGAKRAGTQVAEGAKKAGAEIAAGAKKVGKEVAHGAKRVSSEIVEGAKTAGRVVGIAAMQGAEWVKDAPKNIKESMSGEKKLD